MRIKKVILLIVWTGIVLFIGFVLGVFNQTNSFEKRLAEQQLKKPSYSGQEVFDGVNSYRKAQGISTLVIDSELCNDIVSRYLAFQTPQAEKEGHPGFEEWAKKKLNNGFKFIGENFSQELTIEEVLKGWASSPSHRETLLNPRYNKMCTYAGDFGAVVVFGEK